MKKIILFICMLLPWQAQATLRVVATLPVFAALAQEVGGERISVTSLARGNQDPHFLDAKPSYVAELNRADLLIQGGLDLEVGWLPPILVQSANGKIQPNTAGNVNVAQGLNILEVPKVPLDRSMGDVHPSGNPHVWLDPRNAKLIAANIYQHLVKIDPDGKSYYESRLKDFLNRIDQKIAAWEQETKSFSGKKVISYHKSFSYFAEWTGLIMADSIESKPGIPPSSRHVDDLLKLIPAEGIRLLMVESFYPKKVPQYLSEKSGIPMVLLPTDTEEYGIKTYFELIDYLVREIKSKLG